MIKKIDIAGLQLDNYKVREMLMRVDRRISEKILTTIEEVNMDTLALAESDEEVKQALEACDYSVIADEGILRAVSADTLQRRHEIEDHDFFYEFFLQQPLSLYIQRTDHPHSTAISFTSMLLVSNHD